MKKVFFIITTLISIVSYTFSALLLGLSFTDKDPGMALIFLIPLLNLGLVTGIIAYVIKKTQHLELNFFLIWLHYLNLLLILLGVIALVYIMNN